MLIGFLRFHGQDSAYIFTGSALEAYQKALGDASLTEEDFFSAIADGEVSYRFLEDEHNGLMPVGDML